MRLSLTKLGNIVMIIITIPLTLSPLCLVLIERLRGYTVNMCDFYFYKLIGKLTVFLWGSGVPIAEHDRVQFHFHRTTFSSKLKSKIGNILSKAEVLRIILNLVVSSVLPGVDGSLPTSSTWTDETDGTAEIITHLILVWFTSNFVHLHPLPRFRNDSIFPPINFQSDRNWRIPAAAEWGNTSYIKRFGGGGHTEAAYHSTWATDRWRTTP